MQKDGSAFRPTLVKSTAGFDWWQGEFHTELEDLTIRLSFERMSDGDNGAIWAEARAVANAEGEFHTIIPPSRVNLMNATRSGSGWKGLVSTLSELASSVAWDEAVAAGVGEAIEVYRVGERETELATTPRELGHPFILEPFVAQAGVSVLYGEGGTGKSLLALAMAVAVANNYPVFGQYPVKSGPVVYFDYEDDSTIHEERLAAIMKGLGISKLEHPIWHRKLVAKVSQSQASMRRTIHDQGAVLAILDSIGMGRGGNANTAEDTVRMFRALRSLDVPTLAIDHVSKEDKRAGEIITPYGSVYTINSARLLWGAVVATASSTDTKKYLNLKNTKANRVAPHKDMAISMEYRNERNEEHHTRWLDQVSFAVHDEWGMVHEFDDSERIWAYLKAHDGGYTAKEISVFMGIGENQVKYGLEKMGDIIKKGKRGRQTTYSLAGDESTLEEET